MPWGGMNDTFLRRPVGNTPLLEGETASGNLHAKVSKSQNSVSMLGTLIINSDHHDRVWVFLLARAPSGCEDRCH